MLMRDYTVLPATLTIIYKRNVLYCIYWFVSVDSRNYLPSAPIYRPKEQSVMRLQTMLSRTL